MISARRSTKGEARLSSASACLVPMAMSEVVYGGEVLCSRSSQTEDKGQGKGKDGRKDALINVIF